MEYFRNMNPENLERNVTLCERYIDFEVTKISEENFNITPSPNQNLNLSQVLQKSRKEYPSLPLKSKTNHYLKKPAPIS